MNKQVQFIFVIVTLLFIKCGPTEPGEPPKISPSGYQEDIPWPSLADCPWPKFRHDAQGTNRSQHAGPTQGIIEWINEDFINMTGSVAIDYNNDLFLTSLGYKTGIYKVNGSSGDIEWSYDSLGRVIDLHPSPIMLSDTTIITSSGSEGRLLKLDRNGHLLWEFKAKSQIYNRGIAVDKIGNIYFIDRMQYLYCINSSGKLVWKIFNQLFAGYGYQSLVFSPDGETLYFQAFGVSLVAFDVINKIIKWTFGNLPGNAFTFVDSQGNIYFLTKNSEINNEHSLYCLNDEGAVRWFYEHGEENVTETGTGAPVCIDRNGNIYFSAGQRLISLDYSGAERFIKDLGDGQIDNLIIDKDNKLFIWISGESPRALSLDDKGNKIWEMSGDDHIPKYFGAISGEGQWIVCSYQYINKLFSIK